MLNLHYHYLKKKNFKRRFLKNLLLNQFKSKKHKNYLQNFELTQEKKMQHKKCT